MKTPEVVAYKAAPFCGLHLKKSYNCLVGSYLSETKDILATKAAAVAFGTLVGSVMVSFRSYWISAAVATLGGGLDAAYQFGAKKPEDLYISTPGFFRMLVLTQLITTTKLSHQFAEMVVPAITPLMAIWASYQRDLELSK